MKLLIISHTAHYTQSGEIVGWEPTVQELNHLAFLFKEIRHIAWHYSGPPPSAVLPYSTDRIRLLPAKPSGGRGLLKKFSILAAAPNYMRMMKQNLDWADVVHVRCPSNIGLLGLLLLRFTRAPRFRWIKYATNWAPEGKEPLSFTFQRWWLRKNLHRGIVTINGKWPNQPPHVYSFLNPSVLDEEISWARSRAEEKTFQPPFQFLHVGRIDEKKGLGRALEIVAELRRSNIPLHFDVAGDGERKRFEQRCAALGLQDVVQFHGWLKRSDLNRLYERAHFLLFPSDSSEGWPKVLSEAMAFGVVPVAGAISSIPQVLQELGVGVALPVRDQQRFVDAITNYIDDPESWKIQSSKAVLAVQNFTYRSYLSRLAETFREAWGLDLSFCNPV